MIIKLNMLTFIFTFILSVNSWAVDLKGFKSSEDVIRSAKNGNVEAQVIFGHMYMQGEGVKHDIQEALHWYQKAAEQGDADGQYFYGFMYYEGYGVVKNCEVVVDWMRKSAEQGNVSAQYILGSLLMKSEINGMRCPMNKIESFKWLYMAAKTGDWFAQTTLDELCNESPWACR